MSNVNITEKDGKLIVESPYNPDFPGDARNLGGKWDRSARVWKFDPRDEERVRALVREYYGTDGDDSVSTVTLRIKGDILCYNEQELWLAGRMVAYRPGRDDRVRLGEGCIIVEGGFNGSGGSRKNPRLSPQDGLVIEIRDVPAPLAAEAVEGTDSVWIVDSSEVDTKRVELETRRAELKAQLAEVEAELKALGPLPALDRVTAEDAVV
jgi:hypothetical protein